MASRALAPVVGEYREVHWDLDHNMLKEGPLPPQRVAEEPTRKSVEACLVGDTCSPFTKCPKTASRDCLRASVPFRTPLRHISCCFRCCVNHWLSATRLGRNLDAAGAGMLQVSESASVRYSKPNPDSGDFGLAPRTNVLAHPHMFAAVSDVHVHPMTGCRGVDEKDFDGVLHTAGGALSRRPSNRALKIRCAALPAFDLGNQYKCLKKLRASVSTQRKLVTDYFMPVRWAPENPLQNYLALGLANNVKDSASEKTRERVIGVRGPSFWQAALEHPGYDQLPTDDRLLLCCCMNIDEKHPLRLEHYLILNKHPEFACADHERRNTSRGRAASRATQARCTIDPHPTTPKI